MATSADPTVIAEALRQALASVIGLEISPQNPPELTAVEAPAWSSTLADSEMFDHPALGSERAE